MLVWQQRGVLGLHSEGWVAPPLLWPRALQAEMAEGNASTCLCLNGMWRPGSVVGNCGVTPLNVRLSETLEMCSVFCSPSSW